ncbi:MAG TPA: hypothetical protein VIS06_00805 [Mycobacteriales bacterium]
MLPLFGGELAFDQQPVDQTAPPPVESRGFDRCASSCATMARSSGPDMADTEQAPRQTSSRRRRSRSGRAVALASAVNHSRCGIGTPSWAAVSATSAVSAGWVVEVIGNPRAVRSSHSGRRLPATEPPTMTRANTGLPANQATTRNTTAASGPGRNGRKSPRPINSQTIRRRLTGRGPCLSGRMAFRSIGDVRYTGVVICLPTEDLVPAGDRRGRRVSLTRST